MIYGAAHFYRAAPRDYLSNMGQDIGIVRMLEKDYPGRTFAVIPVGIDGPFRLGSLIRTIESSTVL